MSKPNAWAAFDQLIASPLLSTRNITGRKRQRRKSPKRSQPRSKHVIARDIPDDGHLIEDSSEEEPHPVIKPLTTEPTRTRAEKLQEPGSSLPGDDRPVSDLEDVSEGSPAIFNETSDSSSTDDDCLAIKCRETKMTPLSFKANRYQKRPRITDEDLNTSFISTIISPTKGEKVQMSYRQKRFQRVVVSNQSGQTSSNLWTASPAITEVLGCSSLNTSRWNQLETSSMDQEHWNIEAVSSSSEQERECDDQASGLIESIIESYTPSPVENSLRTSRQDTAPSFYVVSPKEEKRRHRILKHPAGSIIGRLESALREKKSRHNIWNHEVSCGVARSSMVVKVECIDRTYGRVMLYFHTPAEGGNPQELVENIICVDPNDRSLKQLQAGMEIVLDIDDQIAPLRISRNRLVHLGNTRFSLVRTAAPDNKQKQ
ncbi:uncharacterized protein LOC126570953 [Anopheles aquasalis]|uniref:uncharacterized protein LOC126570953 n=1 Tax=Anopheles aquasalis TaxID=42839 RepID=UPI00215A237A|nr:uncharacterized protein LOC126570953 [Anopheles aquasalis]